METMRNDNGDMVDQKRDILFEIAEQTKERVHRRKEKCQIEELRKKAEQMDPNTGFPFEKALKRNTLSFICEVKKASPSKGLIADEFPYLEIAEEYEKAGAAAISCLTEPHYFLGSDQYLEEIAREVRIPVLRKDFVVDEYMIYEAKVLGASAILLICAILDDEQLSEYLQIADRLGLSALVEAHSEEEVQRALASGARVIGVNNRNLRTFEIDMNTSIRLRKLVPENCIFISESGIKGEEDLKKLVAAGVNGVLIGETLMRAENKKALIEKFQKIGQGSE